MARKFWGTIRKVLLDLASDFVEVNEDLEKVTAAKVKEAMMSGGDVFPRGYHIPEIELTINCKATKVDGKVKLLGLGGVENEENVINVTIRAPLSTRPLNKDELEAIAAREEKKIKDALENRGITMARGAAAILEED